MKQLVCLLLLFGLTNDALASNTDDVVIDFCGACNSGIEESDVDDCTLSLCSPFAWGASLFKACFGLNEKTKLTSLPQWVDSCFPRPLEDFSTKKPNPSKFVATYIEPVFDPFIYKPVPPQLPSVAKLADKNQILKNFGDILAIKDNHEKFETLSLEQIEWVFTNKKFATDTENSVLTKFMSWLRKQREINFPVPPSKDPQAAKDNFAKASAKEKEEFVNTYVKPMLKHIDFSQMTSFYFGFIVRNFAEEYGLDYIELLESAKKNYQPIHRELLYAESHQRATMQVVFRKIEEWQRQPKKKYYSGNIHSNGYDFYFFIKKGVNGAEGYVRCVGGTDKLDHLLPIDLSVKIVSTNDKVIKSLPPQKVVFNHFDRSVGFRLTDTKAGETWEKFINGETSLTESYEENGEQHQKATFIIEINFLSELPQWRGKNQFPFTVNFDNDEQKKTMANLSIESVLEILKRKLYAADSQESLFTMLMYWVKAQETKNIFAGGFNLADKSMQEEFIKAFIEPILPWVDFSKMNTFYFDNIVANFMTEYSVVGTEIYNKIKSSYELNRATIEKQLMEHPKKFMMKAEFRDLDTWKLEGKYGSSPMLFNGYTFFFFLRPTENETDGKHLRGFLLVDGNTTNKNHQLPLKFSISVGSSCKEPKRKFSPLARNFFHSEAAWGGKISLPNETWDTTKGLLSETLDGAVKFVTILDIEFLPTLTEMPPTDALAPPVLHN